jgi:hypothetical protein
MHLDLIFDFNSVVLYLYSSSKEHVDAFSNGLWDNRFKANQILVSSLGEESEHVRFESSLTDHSLVHHSCRIGSSRSQCDHNQVWRFFGGYHVLISVHNLLYRQENSRSCQTSWLHLRSQSVRIHCSSEIYSRARTK